MVSLAPPLQASIEIRIEIEKGHSIKESIKIYIRNNPDQDFAQDLAKWLFSKENENYFDKKQIKSPYRRHLIEILERGLSRFPIIEELCDFEKDLIEICKIDLEKYVQKLPFLFLIPLMFFQFPSFILLLLGPLVLDLLNYLV